LARFDFEKQFSNQSKHENICMAPLLAHDLAHVQLTTLSGALAVSCARISRGNGALARE